MRAMEASVPEFLAAGKERADKVKVIFEHRTRFSKAAGNADKETIPEKKDPKTTPKSLKKEQSLRFV